MQGSCEHRCYNNFYAKQNWEFLFSDNRAYLFWFEKYVQVVLNIKTTPNAVKQDGRLDERVF